jgi:hypothetical protein
MRLNSVSCVLAGWLWAGAACGQAWLHDPTLSQEEKIRLFEAEIEEDERRDAERLAAFVNELESDPKGVVERLLIPNHSLFHMSPRGLPEAIFERREELRDLYLELARENEGFPELQRLALLGSAPGDAEFARSVTAKAIDARPTRFRDFYATMVVTLIDLFAESAEEEDIGWLEGLLDDEDPEVVDAARRAIGQVRMGSEVGGRGDDGGRQGQGDGGGVGGGMAWWWPAGAAGAVLLFLILLWWRGRKGAGVVGMGDEENSDKV